MRSVISGKTKDLAGNDRSKSACIEPEPGEALRQRPLAAKPESERTREQGTAGYAQTSGAGLTFATHLQRSPLANVKSKAPLVWWFRNSLQVLSKNFQTKPQG